jgi:hypothetical protein
MATMRFAEEALAISEQEGYPMMKATNVAMLLYHWKQCDCDKRGSARSACE